MRIHGILLDLETLQSMLPTLQQQQLLKTVTDIFHHFFGPFQSQASLSQPTVTVKKRVLIIQPAPQVANASPQVANTSPEMKTMNGEARKSPRISIIVNQHKHHAPETKQVPKTFQVHETFRVHETFTTMAEFYEKLACLSKSAKTLALLNAMIEALKALVMLFDEGRHITFPDVFRV
jgi:hypothetical protein